MKYIGIMISVVFFASLYSCKEQNSRKEQSLTYGEMIDQEGNTYKTITIGTQTWMAENLRVTKYRNGDPILNITDRFTWRDSTDGNYNSTLDKDSITTYGRLHDWYEIDGVSAYANYNNTLDKDSITTYGRLYNWYAIKDKRNIVPKGWHVPTHEEYLILIKYLCRDESKEDSEFYYIPTYDGDKVSSLSIRKSIGDWDEGYDEEISKSNESGFSALPAGYRTDDGHDRSMGRKTYWWTSHEPKWGDEIRPPDQGLSVSFEVQYDGGIRFEVMNMTNGLSVRCIKD